MRSFTIDFDNTESFKNGLTMVLESPTIVPRMIKCEEESLVEYASTKNDIDLLKFLLEDGRFDPNEKGGDYHTTAIESACQDGYDEIVKLLLFDPRVRLEKDLLQRACGHGNLSIVKLLLEDVRIDPNEEGCIYANTALYTTCKYGHLDILNILLSDDRVDTHICETESLFIACRNGHQEIVQRLLMDNRFDPSKSIGGGSTALHGACRRGNIEIVKMLLTDDRVDPHKEDDSHYSPFYYACSNDKKDIIEYMMANYTDLVIPEIECEEKELDMSQ